MDSEATWAADEFGDADLGDVRRTARLIQLATVLGAHPTASLPQATADPATVKAAYRFFANHAVDPDAILLSHVGATMRRLQTVPLVLVPQDTTYLDWTTHPATTGLGPLAAPSHHGVLLHTTVALTPERVPLGLLQQQVWARDEAVCRHDDHTQRPLAEKESQKWLTSLEAVIAARTACPDTRFVSIGDREADLYDLFVVARPPGVDLLVRAAQDRRTTAPEARLWATMATVPVAATIPLALGKRGQQVARTATLAVRYQAVTLRPPKHRAAEQLPEVMMWAIGAVEADPPPGVEPVEWLLLTTVACHTLADALEQLAWYTARWGIEVWHKVLKSGCQIEAKQLATAERLIRCMTVYSVIAWRIVYATMLARAAPDVPCTVLLDADEWQGLYCRMHRVALAPSDPPSLRQAVRWIGQLGGFLGRTRDGEPGVTVLWRGFQQLVEVTAMYRIMRPTPSAPARQTKNKSSG